jgi:hypothetical protein
MRNASPSFYASIPASRGRLMLVLVIAPVPMDGVERGVFGRVIRKASFEDEVARRGAKTETSLSN